MAPKTAQDRPKTGPRSSLIGFLTLEFSLRFLIVLGSILVPFWPPKWRPGGAAELGKSALGRSKTVLGSSWFGSFFVLRFGFAFLVLLDASWGRLGSLLAPFWAVLGSLGLILKLPGGHFGAFNFSDVFSFFLLSALFPWPFSTLLPGPADCALRD